MAIKVTPEQAQRMYDDHLSQLRKHDTQAGVERFLQRFPNVDTYIEWLEYVKEHAPMPQHKRVNLDQMLGDAR